MRRLGLSTTFPLSAAGMLVCGLCVSFALFLLAFRQEQRSEQADFERRTQFRVVAIQQGVNNFIPSLSRCMRAIRILKHSPLAGSYPRLSGLHSRRRCACATRAL